MTPESPIRISSDLKPQADVLVAKGDLSEFGTRGLAPSDVQLVVDVSNSTLRTDRKRKYRHYAEVGIPEYWIINLQTRNLEVYRDPNGAGYATALTYGPGETVTPLFAPAVEIAISEIMPKGRKP